MPDRIVVVTGASGFVGRALCPALREAGWSVRAIVRDAKHAPAGTTAAVVSDLCTADLNNIVRDASAVVHLAARVHQLHDDAADKLAAYRRMNCDLTLRLAKASAQAGVQRFIFLSSVKAVADETGTTPLKDTDEARPGSEYGISKLEAERELTAFAATNPTMSVMTLRPPMVYGPGAVANFQRMLDAVRSGVPLPLRSVRNARSIVYIENLVSSILAALNRAEVSGTFFVTDGVNVSTAEMIEYLAAGMGIKPRLISVPVWLLALAGALTRRSEDVMRLTRSLAVEGLSLCDALQWRPPFTPREGLSQTARWYTEHQEQKTGLATADRKSA